MLRVSERFKFVFSLPFFCFSTHFILFFLVLLLFIIKSRLFTISIIFITHRFSAGDRFKMFRAFKHSHTTPFTFSHAINVINNNCKTHVLLYIYINVCSSTNRHEKKKATTLFSHLLQFSDAKIQYISALNFDQCVWKWSGEKRRKKKQEILIELLCIMRSSRMDIHSHICVYLIRSNCHK